MSGAFGRRRLFGGDARVAAQQAQVARCAIRLATAVAGDGISLYH